ncbi:CBS domain-containing protein [Methanohalophilus levihalophilus]|uniref:CBS domain-containing protein n=1 Tax=Methanohalophilus levihalophilus TaxID=1431282 RepID=UPI001AE721F3|nr:CBS domain-containing protein [Methanohalophilus levihalophilus]MBP2029930.1 CBS domain-containing protein [Methanohalophilus levihalophilus]
MQVQDIMVQPVKVDKADTLSHALDLMEKNSTRRLLVTHDSKLLGILTMRNLTKELGTRKKGTKPASSLHVATAVSENFTKVLPDTEVDDVITLMAKNGGVVIVTDNENILGWVTPQQIMENMEFNGYAGEIMHKEPTVVSPADRVSHVRHIILENDMGRFPVVENGRLMGMVTEKDIAKAMKAFREIVSGNQQDSRIKNLIVEDIMKTGVQSVKTNTPVSEVAKLMLESNYGGVPVMNLEDEMVGFITRRSLLKTLA